LKKKKSADRMKNLFFDLDGTVLDCRRRLYRLFDDLAPGHDLDQDEYWRLKRAGQRRDDLLRDRFGFDRAALNALKKSWMERIEDEDRLALDCVWPGLGEILMRLAARHSLYLVTNRQFRDRTVRQVEGLGLAGCFTAVLVTEQRSSKAALIKAANLAGGPDGVFIGDTGEDVLAARELGCRAVAVSWGFSDRGLLAAYRPDVIMTEVDELDQCPFL